MPKLMIENNQIKLDEITTSERVNVNSEIEGGTVDEVTQSKIYSKTSDSTWQAPRIDTITHTLQTISYPHHEVHSGSHYYLEGFTSLDTDGTLYVKLVTPDTAKWAHFSWEISSNGILEAYLYEGVSGGMTGGTGVTPINNNRNSGNTSGLVITSGVTVADNLGTLISQAKMGGEGFKTNIGGSSIRTNEIILKQDTIYLRKFLSGSNSNIISFRASFYEHTNKEA